MKAFFLVLLVFLTEAYLCYSQEKNPFPPNPVVSTADKSSAFKDVYGGSRNSPVLGALRRQGADVADHLSKLQEWYNNISMDVQKRRDDSDGSECTLRGQPWIKEGDAYVKDRNFDKISVMCATRTEHSVNKTLAFQYLERSADIFQAAAAEAIKTDKHLSELWNPAPVKPLENLKYKSSDEQKCKLNYLMAIRARGIWYIAAAATSKGPNAGGKRLGIVEHVPADINNGNLLSLPMHLLPFNASGVGNDNRKNYTTRGDWFSTAYSVTTGSAQISGIHRMRYDDNGALQSALDDNMLAVDQAKDAITAANMAILILPLFMSFIPVALIADLSEAATLFYVLLTDVFAAVPFVIKGVELVITGTTEQRSAETWMMGEKNQLQIAETWTANCQPKDEFRKIGVVVIAIGMASIFTGILIEILARRWMSKRRDMGEQPEPFGPALLRMDSYIPVSSGYIHPDFNDEFSPNFMADLPPPPPTASGSANSRLSNLFGQLISRQGRRMNGPPVQDSTPQPPVAQVSSAVLGMRRRGSSTPNIGQSMEEP